MKNLLSTLNTSWGFGLGTLAAFVLPWLLLPHSLFLGLLVFYAALCMLGMIVICLLMTWRELVRSWRMRTRTPHIKRSRPT